MTQLRGRNLTRYSMCCGINKVCSRRCVAANYTPTHSVYLRRITVVHACLLFERYPQRAGSVLGVLDAIRLPQGWGVRTGEVYLCQRVCGWPWDGDTETGAATHVLCRQFSINVCLLFTSDCPGVAWRGVAGRETDPCIYYEYTHVYSDVSMSVCVYVYAWPVQL